MSSNRVGGGIAMSSNRVGGWSSHVVEPCWRWGRHVGQQCWRRALCRRTVLAAGAAMSLNRVGGGAAMSANSVGGGRYVVEPCWRLEQPCRRTVLAVGPPCRPTVLAEGAMSSNRVGGRASHVVEPCWRLSGIDGGHRRDCRGCGRRRPGVLAPMDRRGWGGPVLGLPHRPGVALEQADQVRPRRGPGGRANTILRHAKKIAKTKPTRIGHENQRVVR